VLVYILHIMLQEKQIF